LGGCGTPPAPQIASTPATDASVVGDAGVDEGVLDAGVMAVAPALDASAVVGSWGDEEQQIVVDGSTSIELPMTADGCLRVVFAAGDPIDVALGGRTIAGRSHGVLPENGTVCERAGHPIRLVFSGRANVRYQVFRVR